MADCTPERKSKRLADKIDEAEATSHSPCPLSTPPLHTPPKQAKERNKQYQARLLADPDKAQLYKEARRQYSKAYRDNATQDQKKHMNELAKLRMQKVRLNRKADLASGIRKPRTRKDDATKLLERAKATEAKKKWRMKRTPQKKMWENKKRRDQRASKKKVEKEAAEKAVMETSLDSSLPIIQSDKTVDPLHRIGARRQALYRARKSMPKDPEQFAELLESLHDTASPRKKKAFKKRGISLDTSRLGAFFIDSVEDLKGKKDLSSRTTRMVLISIYKSCRSLSKTSKILNMNKKTIVNYLHPKPSLRLKKRDEVKKQVQVFFENNAVPLPNKKLVSKKTGLAQSVLQKRVADYHKEFTQHGGHISLAQFSKCRPKHIRKMASAGLNQCLCEYCTNCDLKIKAINKIGDNTTRICHVYHAVALSTCENGGKVCAYRQCPRCGIKKLEDYLSPLQNHEAQLSWYRWTTKKIWSNGKQVSRKVLNTSTGGINDLIQELLQEMIFLSEHLFRAKWQHQQFESLRNRQPFPSALLIIVMDFAENYTCIYQHEVQSAHWHHEQVTIHPIASYYKCPTCEKLVNESLIFISNDTGHDYHAVHTFIQQTISHLQQARKLELELVIEWSDGCGVQYKSKGPFADVAANETDFGLPVHRSYFGSRHGKGPCDGEAAVLKQHATSSVKAGTVIISNATDFFQYCIQSSLNKQPADDGVCTHFLRTFFWVPEGSIERTRPGRLVKTVKGTRSFHHIKSTGSGGTLVTRHLTCLCDSCLSGRGDCPSMAVVGAWTEHTLIPENSQPTLPATVPDPSLNLATQPDQPPQSVQPCKLDQPKQPPQSDQPPQLDQPNQLPHSDQPPQLDQPNQLPHSDQAPQLDQPNQLPHSDQPNELPEPDHGGNSDRLRKGSWIKVAFTTGKSTKEFIGKVISADRDTGEVQLQFLRCRGTFYTWPDTDDVAWVNLEQIVATLGHPDITARGQYYFQ